MNKEKVEKEVKKLLDFDITEQNNVGIVELSRLLEDKDMISFSIVLIEDYCDCWLQVDYYEEAIEKTIILNYDFPDNFESIKYFVDSLEAEEKEMNRVKAIINN